MRRVPSVRSESWTSSHDNDARIKLLEGELNRAKDSESKMLESLTFQTKQLEETKIELEEAKLEIRTLEEMIEDLERPTSYINGGRDKERRLENKGGGFDVIHAQKEIARLKNELKLALGAEKKSKSAMDDLAVAMKEVTTEANKVKSKLLATETELLDTRAGAEYLKTTLKGTEEKLRQALKEVQRLKMEAEESSVSWNAKQEGFRDCMRLLEEEISRGNDENSELIDAQRGLKDEISKARDIMKQALNEATVVKEALEIAKNENSQLKDTLAEKQNALRSMGMGQELDCINKVGKAAARGSVEGSKKLLVATSNSEPNENTGSLFDNRPSTDDQLKPAVPDEAREPRKLVQPRSDSSTDDGDHIPGRGNHQKGGVRPPESTFRHPSFGGPNNSIKAKPSQRRFTSFSGLPVREAPHAVPNGPLDIYGNDSDHKSFQSGGLRLELVGTSATMRNEKKPAFRKVFDILRRRRRSNGSSSSKLEETDRN